MNTDIKKAVRLGVYGLALFATACTQTGVDSPAKEVSVPSEAARQNHGNSPVKTSDGQVMDQQITDAVTDLAVRTGIETDKIKITQARAVTWGSSALGCPKEGMNYTQAIVPGVLLLLDASGVIYHYHGRAGKSLFYCPDGRATAPAYGPGKEIM